MDNLEATNSGMTKIADNELFDVYSYEDGNGPWIAATVFKHAYSKFREGDIVIQYGKISSEINTLRRRFGSAREAVKNLSEALEPVYTNLSEANFRWGGDPLKTHGALVPGVPSPKDSFHDIQTGPSSGGGPYTKRHDWDSPARGPRDGFDRSKGRRKQDMERNLLPYEDQQVSNQTQIFGEVGNYAAPVVETPEERAGQIEQDIPKPINLDLKRPFPNKRKRTNPNESQLTGQPGGLFQEHNNPKVMQNI